MNTRFLYSFLFILPGIIQTQDINYELLNYNIPSYTASTVPNKFSLSISYNYNSSDTWYDADGKKWKDGQKIINKSAFGDTLGIDTFSFYFIRNVLNLNLDFANSEKSGVYLNIPVYLNHSINNNPIPGNNADFSLAVYFIWKEIFPIQRIRTDIFYKHSSNKIPDNSVYYLGGIGKNLWGTSVAIDLLLSDKSYLSNKLSFSISDKAKYITDFGDKSKLGPASFLNFSSRVKYQLSKRLATGVDLEYRSASLYNAEFNNTTSNFFGIKPILGYTILSHKDFGYVKIRDISLLGSLFIPLKINNYYRPQIFSLTTDIFFE